LGQVDRMLGNSTFAGATAAIMANVVLVAYVVVAMREDQSEAIEAAEKEKEKKGR
jgi:vacuolar ATPase assembly integral membrane protein VMA21